MYKVLTNKIYGCIIYSQEQNKEREERKMEKERFLTELKYGGGVIGWKDDLGRWCVHNQESKYSKESDYKIYGTKKEAERAASFYKKNGRWPD